MQLRIILLSLALCSTVVSIGQLTLSNGKHVLELTGALTSYYNYRVMKPGETDLKNNRFKLRDAQLQLEGRISDKIEYELQFDLVDIAANTGAIDPENPGLMDAYVTYVGFKWFDIKLGYSKLNYSRSSLTPFIYSPFWQRAEYLRGDLFSRRDVGITLSQSFWKQRINVSAGAYNGLGELSLQGKNDATGSLEYVGRVDLAYPSRYRFREIDTRHVPIPMFAVGFNGRYTDKTLPEGESFPAYAVGEYLTKMVDGEKLIYGMDASFQYKGISAQFEIHQIKAKPADSTSYLYRGYSATEADGYVLLGGYNAQLNYFSKKLKTIISVRYEDFNLSDLAPGSSQRASLALAYQIDGFNSMIKFQYFNILSEEASIDPLKWTEQFRIGWQFLFK